MNREEFFRGEEQFNPKIEEAFKEWKEWDDLKYPERVKKIITEMGNIGIIPTAEKIIFKNLGEIREDQRKKLSTPLQKIVEKAIEKLEKGE